MNVARLDSYEALKREVESWELAAGGVASANDDPMDVTAVVFQPPMSQLKA